METKTTMEDAARRLRDAYSGPPVAPLRGYVQPGDTLVAYTIQAINTRYWQTDGRRVVGRKVGLTATAVQTHLSASEPGLG